MLTTSFPPRSCACGCGKVFTPKVYNEAHASVTCARRAAQKRRTLRAQAERATDATPVALQDGWRQNPSIELLNATELLLVAAAVPAGQTFCGTIPEWHPTDTRVDWTEVYNAPGVWNMTFLPL